MINLIYILINHNSYELISIIKLLIQNIQSLRKQENKKMQNNKVRQYVCPSHPQQKILFICAINDWHFQPLCQLCTPVHTQNHSKRLKVNLKSFQQINKESTLGVQSVLQQYNKRIKSISQILTQKSLHQKAFEQIQQIEKNIQFSISKFFENLKEKVKEEIKNIEKIEVQKMMKISDVLCAESKQIAEILQQKLDLQSWKLAAKKIHFKDKLQIYMQETQQNIKQYQQKAQSTKIIDVKLSQDKIFKKMNEILENTITIWKEKIQEPKQIKSSIKKPILKPKKKLCKNCNQEMQYLTQNKKHLICKYCNNKERNYTKKPY